MFNGPNKPQDRYMRLDNEIERSNQKFIEDTNTQQQVSNHSNWLNVYVCDLIKITGQIFMFMTVINMKVFDANWGL